MCLDLEPDKGQGNRTDKHDSLTFAAASIR